MTVRRYVKRKSMRACKRMAAAVLAFGLGVSLPGQTAWAKDWEDREDWTLSEAVMETEGREGFVWEAETGPAPKNTGSSQVSRTGPPGDSQDSAAGAGPDGGGNGSPQVSQTSPSEDSQGASEKPSGPVGTEVSGQAPSDPAGGTGTSGQAPPGPAGGTGTSGQTPSGPAGGTGTSGQASSGPAGGTQDGSQAPGDFAGRTDAAGVTQASDGPSSSGSNPSGETSGAGQANAGNQEDASIPRPEIKSEGAVVMDAATGKILLGKNETARFYPASITKLMTAMLVLEKTDLSDMVTFSKSATTNLESGASTLNLTEGDRLTVEQCLYGLLLKSANEIGNALAEHISGSVSGFADLMNQRAAQLGCTGTHFANPHGLNNSNHYTTPYDMALIARAAFQNETLCRIDTTVSYQFPATKKEGARTISMGHKMMLPSDSRYYEGIIGGKTGYTSLAGNTLVTGAQRDGVRLVAVVMKSKSTHYEDTKALLDYGFAVMARSKGGEQVRESGDASQKPSLGWKKDGQGWIYIKQDGNQAAGEWVRDGQTDYWIDPDGYMATGWRQFADGDWYYFRSNGAKAVDYWVMDYGKWFYLGAQGVMLAGTRTPDGYALGADGAWIP